LAEIPGMNGRKGVTAFVEHDLVVFKDSKDPKLAAEFVDFMSGPEGMAIYTKILPKYTARKSSSQIDFYKASTDPYMATFLKILDNALPLPCKNPSFLEAMESVAVGIQKVALTDEPIKQIVAEMDKEVKAIYAE
jgi:ABC-type glycerol-3-phosphate transport system substrate-binding protein